MNWVSDPNTQYWATLTHPNWPNVPATQYAGNNMAQASWGKYILNPAGYPGFCVNSLRPAHLVSTPANIIQCFSAGLWLEALALVVSWGQMSRSVGYIYIHGLGVAGLTPIQNALANAQRLIIASAPIPQNRNVINAWNSLQVSLGWSAVITSKTLHFLVRSLGVHGDPPVALDNAAIRQYLWPSFKSRMQTLRITSGVNLHPRSWGKDDIHSYNRYMTAITTWANLQGWSTTQVENTIFAWFIQGHVIAWL